MDTNIRKYAPWSLYGLLILAYFGNVCSGAGEKKMKEYADSSGDLSCYVCNSRIGKCEDVEDGMKIKCKDGYFPTVYGEAGSADTELKKWPLSLSEISSQGTAGGDNATGWVLGGGFPSAFEKGKGIISNEDTHRFSTFENIVKDDAAMKLDGGFKSCKVMKITVESQVNGNKRVEIPKTDPSIIRTCSFVDADKKIGKDNFNEQGCRLFNYKTAAVEVCYCKDDDCNGSSYLHGSYWMIAASVLALFARNF